MKDFIGRQKEIAILEKLIKSKNKSAKLIRVDGRRRVGKTKLVDYFASLQKNCLYLKFIGNNELDYYKNIQQNLLFLKSQLSSCSIEREVIDKFLNKHKSISRITNWTSFFLLLNELFLALPQTKILVFFDEVHWYDSHNKFINYFASSWNLNFANHKNLYIFLTSSSSSWATTNMNKNNNLYQRFDVSIQLKPFTIEEIIEYCELYYSANRKDIAKYYLMFGGIIKYYNEDYINFDKPFEWNLKRFSTSEFEELIVQEQKELFQSFFGFKKIAKIINELDKQEINNNNLFYYQATLSSLCKSKSLIFSEVYEKVVTECEKYSTIKKPQTQEIRSVLENLALTNLIEVSQIDNFKQGKTFMIKDLFCYFVYYWKGQYQNLLKENQFYSTWKGSAFEIFMLNNKHLFYKTIENDNLQFMLNWRDKVTLSSSLSGSKTKAKESFQVDLVIKEEFKDEAIFYLVENKMYEDGFKFNREEGLKLEQKLDIFEFELKKYGHKQFKVLPLYVVFNGYSEVGKDEPEHLHFDLINYVESLS